MDTPPEGNLTVDLDTLAHSLSCLNVEAKLPGSTPKSTHSKRRRKVGSKITLLSKKPVLALQANSLMEQTQWHSDSHPWVHRKNRLWLASCYSILREQDGFLEPAKVTGFGKTLEPMSRVRSTHSTVEQVLCFTVQMLLLGWKISISHSDWTSSIS
jgi:hypothetical protein